MLQLDNISLQLGAKPLFSGLKLTVPTRAKIGVVGSNGSGKSSLLKVLAGIIEPDSGRVVRPSGISIEYVAQSESFIQGESALSYVLRRIGKRLESHSAEVAAAVALTQAGFTDLEISVDQLSGGWRKRLALAAALAVEPEILLLDEPTNHLDVNGLTWLEELLEGSQFGWVVVSHDRYFLERTVNQIVELSRIYPTGMAEYSGSYLTFKERRAEYLEQEAKRTSSLANLAKRELEWAARSPKARTGKAAFRMKQAAKLASDLKIANARHDRHQSVTEFQSSSRETRELVQMIKTTFQYAGKTPSDKPLIDHLTYTIGNGSCLGLLGANGQGKSTLLKLIGGKLQPSAGKVKQAQDLKVVYFDQLREALSNSKTLGELIGDGAQHVFYNGKPLHIVGWGKRFGFEMDEHGKPISELSGGERARALLSVLVRQEADLLLLDEPTNDLDIPMLEALEQMILEFPGATILVSHDRFLLDEVCSDFLGFLPDGRLLQFASYEQWFMTCQEVNKELELRPKAALKPSSSARFSIEESDTPPQRSTNTKKLSYKLQLEYDQIAEKIELAERQLAEIEQRAADPHEHRDATNSKAISAQLTSAQAEVERLYRRWEELEEIYSKA